jgi:hypothetical protein
MMKSITTYQFSLEKMRGARRSVWNIFLFLLVASPFLAIIRWWNTGKFDWEIFVIIPPLLIVCALLYSKLVVKEPADRTIFLSPEGVYFPSVTHVAIPWQGIDRLFFGDELPTIGFAINSAYISKNEMILTNTASRAKKRWDLYYLEFIPSLYEREGPSMAEQIRSHAPHLIPPSEGI